MSLPAGKQGNEAGEGRAKRKREEAESQDTGAGPNKRSSKSSRPVIRWDAVLALADNGPFLGDNTKLGKVSLLVLRTAEFDPRIGFSIEVPIGAENEDSGFGARCQAAHHNRELGKFKQTHPQPSHQSCDLDFFLFLFLFFQEEQNRFGNDVKVSALAFLQAPGMPVYRLWTQLPMCTDMFGPSRELVYKDLDKFKYGPRSNPSDSTHAIGRSFEHWLLNVRRFPGLWPSREGTMEPVWMHIPDTRFNKVGSSKLNRAQVMMTLHLLSDFVKAAKVDPSNIVVIAPYKINTVDSFHGCEGDIAAVIFGTNPASGPGFTSNESRLNIMLTRQKSGLLLVGDMGVTGPLEGKEAAKADKKAATGVRTFGADGESTYVKAAMLRALLVRMHNSGRFFRMTEAEEDKGVEEEAVGEIEG